MIVKKTKTYPSTNIDLNHVFIWQLWLLKISTKGKSTITLFYSWIIPSDSKLRGWQNAIEEVNQSISVSKDKVIRVELIRTDYFGTGRNIQTFLLGLLKGMHLNEIETEDTSPIPNSFFNLNLGGSSAEIENNFVIRPEVMLPLDHLLLPWTSKTTPNPTEYSVFVNQLFFKSKMNLLSFDGFDMSSLQIKEIIQILTGQLKKATGFDMTKESAPRIGNIEWYRLPVSDSDLVSLISYGAIKDDGTAKGVGIYLRALGQPSKNVLIRCRIINGEEISLDQVKEMVWGDSDITLDFFSQQPVSEIEVTVWEKDADGIANILFEQSSICIRSMRTRMSLIGSQINSGRINLLNKLAGKEQYKKTDLAKYNRSTSASVLETGGYDKDSWVSSSRSVMDFMKKLYPQKSEGHFFLNGWDKEKEQSGQLSFIEWIFKLISGDQRGGLIFIDPYFDEDAIEIFANARTTNTQFRIVTCTQHREKQDLEDKEVTPTSDGVEAAQDEGLTGTAQKIRNACERFKPLLKGLELYVNDLVSIARGKQQIFHDRYLLLLDREGNITCGFHLSNSLQGATRKAPLLVTPIPVDILPSVYAYVENLIHPENDAPNAKKIQVIQLYPLPEVDSESLLPIDKPENPSEPIGKLNEVPEAKFFFSKLLDDPSIEMKTDLELFKLLKTSNLVPEDRGSFQLYELSPLQISTFVACLNSCSQKDFNRLFTALGQTLARGQFYKYEHESNSTSYDGWKLLSEAVRQYPNIAKKLMQFLETLEEVMHFDRDRVRIYQLYNESTFEEVLENTIRELNHMSGDFFGIEFHFYYGCKLLLRSFPKKAVGMMEILLEQARKEEWNEAVPSLRATLLFLSAFAHRTLRYYHHSDIDLQVCLLKSKDFSVRASACGAVVQYLVGERQDNYDFESLQATLSSNLCREEYLLTISAYAAELNTKQDLLEKKVYGELVENWIVMEGLTERVIKVLSGRLEFNQSFKITKNFLNPLIAKKILTNKWSFDYWNIVFERKIKFREVYVNNSSYTTSDHFSSNTDFELSNTIIHFFKRLRASEQQLVLNRWFELVFPLWMVINKPFGYHSSLNSFIGAAERIYWLTNLLEIMIDKKLIKTQVLDDSNNFLMKYQPEIEKVERQLNRGAYMPILGLKANYKS